jgi:hypothetical protein
MVIKGTPQLNNGNFGRGAHATTTMPGKTPSTCQAWGKTIK